MNLSGLKLHGPASRVPACPMYIHLFVKDGDGEVRVITYPIEEFAIDGAYMEYVIDGTFQVKGAPARSHFSGDYLVTPDPHPTVSILPQS